jgi:nicotinate-nucleotide adenylyltransferase
VSGKHRCIGLLGGTFDPVHEGHVAVALQAEKCLGLDRIVFIPAADPPHKNAPQAAYSHRVAMLELAVAGHETFSLSLLEAERDSLSYTYDTLVELKKRLGNQRFFFIMGADSLLDLHHWHRFRDILQMTDIVVAARPGISRSMVHKSVHGLTGGGITDCSPAESDAGTAGRFFYLTDVDSSLSSTAIRRSIGLGTTPAGLAPAVLEYINHHRLYRDDRQPSKKGHSPNPDPELL